MKFPQALRGSGRTRRVPRCGAPLGGGRRKLCFRSDDGGLPESKGFAYPCGDPAAILRRLAAILRGETNVTRQTNVTAPTSVLGGPCDKKRVRPRGERESRRKKNKSAGPGGPRRFFFSSRRAPPEESHASFCHAPREMLPRSRAQPSYVHWPFSYVHWPFSYVTLKNVKTAIRKRPMYIRKRPMYIRRLYT